MLVSPWAALTWDWVRKRAPVRSAPREVGVAEVGADEVRAARLASREVGGDQVGAAKVGVRRGRRRGGVCRSGRRLGVPSTWVCLPRTSLLVLEQQLVDLGSLSRHVDAGEVRLVRLSSSTRSSAARRCAWSRLGLVGQGFGEVPEQFVQLAEDRQRGEHLGAGLLSPASARAAARSPGRRRSSRRPCSPGNPGAAASVDAAAEVVVAGSRQGSPAGLSIAKSADLLKVSATQQRPKQLPQSARRLSSGRQLSGRSGASGCRPRRSRRSRRRTHRRCYPDSNCVRRSFTIWYGCRT